MVCHCHFLSPLNTSHYSPPPRLRNWTIVNIGRDYGRANFSRIQSNWHTWPSVTFDCELLQHSCAFTVCVCVCVCVTSSRKSGRVPIIQTAPYCFLGCVGGCSELWRRCRPPPHYHHYYQQHHHNHHHCCSCDQCLIAASWQPRPLYFVLSSLSFSLAILSVTLLSLSLFRFVVICCRRPPLPFFSFTRIRSSSPILCVSVALLDESVAASCTHTLIHTHTHRCLIDWFYPTCYG